VRDDVRGACELLGLDPLYVANEGRFVACVAPHDAARALQILGADAAIIGEITGAPPRVILQNRLGANRILDMLPGDQLPRIC
jgi:hydrogenase expression/formation protein HypE